MIELRGVSKTVDSGGHPLTILDALLRLLGRIKDGGGARSTRIQRSTEAPGTAAVASDTGSAFSGKLGESW